MGAKTFLLTVAAQIVLAVLPLRAGVVLFDDFAPNTPAYDSSHGYTVGTSGNFNFSESAEFTAAGSGSLSLNQIDLGFYALPSAENTFEVALYTDGNGVPQSPIASWRTNANLTFGGITSITGISGVTLAGGGTYFLTMSALGGDNEGFWDYNNQGVMGVEDYTQMSGQDWATRCGDSVVPAFDLLGTVTSTPEPRGFALLATSGLAALCACWRAARRTRTARTQRG